MAINPVRLITATNATATLGSPTISVSGNVDCSKIYQGAVVQVAGNNIVEALSGTAPNESGISTITLRNNWPFPNVTGYLTAHNTIEGLAGAIEKATQVVEESQGINSLGGTGLVERTGTNQYATRAISTLGKSLINQSSTSGMSSVLGLGTSAPLDVTVSSIDSTLNRVMKTGDFGLGSSEGIRIVNLDSISNPTGSYYINDDTIGTKPIGITTNAIVTISARGTTQRSQILHSVQLNKSWSRSYYSGVWSEWQPLFNEVGSNSNGSYTKFPDGTLICYSTKVSSNSVEITWVYPFSFASRPVISGSVVSSAQGSFSYKTTTLNNSSLTFSVYNTANSRVSVVADIIAVGRWK